LSWTLYMDKSRSPHLPEIRTYWNQRTLRPVEKLSFVLTLSIVLVVVFLFFENISVVLLVRISLSLCGALLLWIGWIHVRSFHSKKQINHRYVMIVFLVLFLAEILGRYMFFAAYFRLGL